MKKSGWLILLIAGLVLIAVMLFVLPYTPLPKIVPLYSFVIFLGELLLILSLTVWRISRGKAKSNNLFKALTVPQIVLASSLFVTHFAVMNKELYAFIFIGIMGIYVAAIMAFVKLIKKTVSNPNTINPAPPVKMASDVQEKARLQNASRQPMVRQPGIQQPVVQQPVIQQTGTQQPGIRQTGTQKQDLRSLIKKRIPNTIQNATTQRRLLNNLSIALPFVKTIVVGAFELKALESKEGDPVKYIAQIASKIESTLDKKKVSNSEELFGMMDLNGKIDAFIITDYYVFLLGEEKAVKLSSVRAMLMKMMREETGN